VDILEPRLTYGPFEYPQFYEYYKKQQSVHWLIDEINLSSDVNDWKLNLTDTEKHLISSILKGFTQAEIFIGNDYWSSVITKRFKKPEIQMMAACFASFEAIHADSYSSLEETLGLQDYESFLKEPTAKAKIDRLMSRKTKTKEDLALSLAIFSAFNEGVNLFSSFAVLLSFSKRNLLKGVAQIIAFSIADESLHSNAGCELFTVLIKENPSMFTDEMKKQLYDAARLTVELEDAFLEQAFSKGSIEGLSLYDMKQFIRHRTNSKLEQLGLKKNWKNVDKEAVDRMSWFDVLSNNNLSHQDFFSGRVSNYSKGLQDWESIWE
jgi:ribonucleoside-diphosphate reductase beta chain